GLEAAQRIRTGEAGEENRRIPVIAMTAHALPEHREKCVAAGMDDFVAKPVDFQTLGSILEKTRVRKRGRRRGRRRGERGGGAIASGEAKTVLNRADLLRRIGGDEELSRELYHLFLKTAPGVMANLQGALERADEEAVIFHAHALKGSSRNIGAESCSHFSRQIELLAREEKLHRIAPVFQKLTREFEKVMARMS
ncbi:MAG: response regulator, partial [Desulfobacterales bacterium]|nr:response regulator [Desulfobacterales bacterium]